jgi:hypothetical protein
MNFKTTLVLLLLAAVGGLLLWYGPQPPTWLEPATSRPAVVDAGTRAELATIQAPLMTRIEVRRNDTQGTAAQGQNKQIPREGRPRLTGIDGPRVARTTVLVRTGAGWTMPGNWPARTAEADELARTLASLHSRFEPVHVSSEEVFQEKGLHPPDITIDLWSHEPRALLIATASTAGLLGSPLGQGPVAAASALTPRRTETRHRLELGEERKAGDDRFARPTYLRLDRRNEVVRLAPGLVARLDRPADYYQQRRLFPGERVVKDDSSAEKVERLSARSVRVEDKKSEPPFTLARAADGSWELEKPARDRLDARSRDTLLQAVPDLWAENFVRPDPAPAVLAAAEAGLPPPLRAAAALFWFGPQGLLTRSGLYAPERTLTVTRSDGTPITLLIGNASGSRARKVLRPPPQGMPPDVPARALEQTVFDEYRYAKLKDNDQVFEIKADKLRDVFVALDSLREPQVAPFNTADARRLEITHGKDKLVLARENDHWKLLQPVQADADSSKVTELLSKLSGLQARDKDIIDSGDLKKYHLDRPEALVKVTLEEETRDKDSKGEKIKKRRDLTVRLGLHDAKDKKLYVQAEGWPRTNRVEDGLEALVRRPALAYRGKRVLDFGAADLAKLEVQRGAERYTLERTAGGWRLLSPASVAADGPKVDQLAGTLGGLEVLEYVSDAPAPQDLEPRYGLGKLPLTVRLAFRDPSKAARTLQVGKARDGKPGYFARLADNPDRTTPVFAISKEVHEALDRDALAYRPAQLWQVQPDEVAAIRIRRDKEPEYSLGRDAGGWKVTGPFDAPALASVVQALAGELAAPQCQSYKVHEAKDLAPYGLDKPHLGVTVRAKNGTEHTLLVGAPAGKDAPARYARLRSGPAVFVVGDALVRAADRPALDLLDPTLAHIKADQVTRVQSKNADSSMTLERQGGRWRVTQGPGAPFEADADAAAALAGVLSGLRAERFAAYGPTDWKKYGLDRPAATVTVALKPQDKATAEHVIELGGPVEGNPGGRYARVDRGAGVAVLGAAAEVLGRTHLDYVNRHLLRFKAAEAQALVRQQGAEVLEAIKKGDSWRLVKPADEPADEQAMQELLAQLADLRARRIAAYPLKDSAAYGLDRPVVLTVKLPAARPAEHVVKIGKPLSGTGGERYVQVDGASVVGVLPAALADRLTAGPIAFRDRTLTQPQGEVDSATLERGPRKAVFRNVEGTWRLTEPLEAPAEQDDLDVFVNALARLRADALVADRVGPEGLRKYGLDKPEARWRLAVDKKEVLQLDIGNAEEHDSRRYARLAQRGDLVFLLDAKLSARALGEFRPRAVWNPPLDASQVESLRYTWARSPFVLDKADGGTWQVLGKPDVKVNGETVSEVLAALAKLQLVRYVVDKGADLRLFGLDRPELILEISTRGGRRVLAVGGFAEGTRQRYARIEGADRSDVFLLDEADCARIFQQLAGFTRPPAVSAPSTPPPPTAVR